MTSATASAHLRVAGEVGLEHQPERLALGVDEREVRRDGGRYPLLVVGGGGQRPAGAGEQLGRVLLEQLEVEVPLAGEVLVQHGLADAGSLGDLVHRRGVVTLRDEDLPRGAEQLGPPGAAGQPCTAHARLGSAHLRDPTGG